MPKRPAPRLPGVPRVRKGRRRYTRAERRLLKPVPRRCRRCNRMLKTRDSIKAGIGPACQRALDAEAVSRLVRMIG